MRLGLIGAAVWGACMFALLTLVYALAWALGEPLAELVYALGPNGEKDIQRIERERRRVMRAAGVRR